MAAVCTFLAKRKISLFVARKSLVYPRYNLNRYRSSCFDVIDGSFNPNEPQCQESYRLNEKLEEKVKKAIEKSLQGGGERGIKRHTEVNKKIFVRDRIKRILDNGMPSLEIGPFAGFDLEYGDVVSAGGVTVLGYIGGKMCIIIANDATVKGGTIYPIGVKKTVRTQQIAEENHLPTVHLTDSGGAFLPLQSEVFPGANQGGRVFYNEAIGSAKSIPQICLVAGSCTAGGAYIPTMADEAIIVDQIGSVFLGGPPLVYAATGEIVSQEELGGATMHCSVSGALDHFADNEDDGMKKIRQTFETLNLEQVKLINVKDVEDPLYNASDLKYLSLCENQNGQRRWDILKILARIVDGSKFQEFKAKYGTDMVCGFAHLHGILIGIVSNQEAILSVKGCTKATHFVQMCSQRKIPIVFMQTDTEKTEDTFNKQMQLKLKGALMSAIACSQVPRITLLLGNVRGPDYYVLGGQGMGSRYHFAWPGSSIHYGANEAELEYLKMEVLDDDNFNVDEVLERNEIESSVFYAASRLWNDGIILPQDSRSVLALALKSTLFYKPIQSYQQAFIRM